eukprot:TRINITY_DN6446_c0_g1_i2.p1 TRINITY_DN6446_c0_g1~~TRINITY_DN6446_c0_g1_i2.p1  ORF type:complete len:670 (-),score=179.23 TRINITY_DN6446_c0_g1_i2:1652-3661(-)
MNGLSVKNFGGLLPLYRVHVTAEIVDFAVNYDIKLYYRNDRPSPIEAIFGFGLPPSTGVCGFVALIDGKKIVGEIQGKSKAEEIYDDALASGKGAYLLSKSETDPNRFEMSVGNFPPNSDAEISISVVGELRLKHKKGEACMEFDFPHNLIPPGVSFTGSLDIRVSYPILDITSDLNFTKRSSDGLTSLDFNMTCTTASTKTLISIKGGELPTMWMEKWPIDEIEGHPCRKESAAMISFFPEFNSDQISDVQSEVIFLIDRSGSMAGSPMAEVIKTMDQVFNILPSTIYYNIIGFGSRMETLFSDQSHPFKGIKKTSGLHHVATMQADLGGTNLSSPLQWILNQPVRKNFSRQIFLLTDGQVDDRQECVNIVRKSVASTRIFTFGIGNVDRQLVSDLAKFSHGKSALVTKVNMKDSVVKQVKRAMQPALTDIQVEWEGSGISHAPRVLPPIWNRERYVVYANFPERTSLTGVLTASAPNGISVKFRLIPSSARMLTGKVIHRLTARALVHEMENDSNVDTSNKDKIAQLGMAYALVTTQTSFVGVEERSDPIFESMELVTQMAPQPPATRIDSNRSRAMIQLDALDAVQSIMHQNISLCLERSDNIESLMDHSHMLSDTRSQFKLSTRTLRRRLWWRNMRVVVGLACCLLLLLIYIIVTAACGFSWKCD